MEDKSRVTFEDFTKLDLRAGTVLEADLVPNSEKLIRLIIDVGFETRQVIAGIQKTYNPRELIGRQVVLVTNLESRILAGLESQGMILAGHTEDGKSPLVSLELPVQNGSRIS